MALWQTELLEESHTARLAALLTERLKARLWEVIQVPSAVRQVDSGDAGDYWVLDVGADHGIDYPDVTETTVPSVDLDHVPPASVGVIREEQFASQNDLAHIADAHVATSGGTNPPPTSLSDTVPSVGLDHMPPASVGVISEEEFPSQYDRADVADADVATSGGTNPTSTSLSDPGGAELAAVTGAISPDASTDYTLTATEFMASLHSANADLTGDRRTIVSPAPAVDVLPAVPLPAPGLLLIGALFGLPAIRAIRDRKAGKTMRTKSSLGVVAELDPRTIHNVNP